MTDFAKIKTQFAELVGFHEENEISLSANLQTSNSGLYVNDLQGVDLISIEKAGFLKSDLTPENTVSEYLTKIYNDEVQKLTQKFIDKAQIYFQHSEILSDFDLQKQISQNLVEQEGNFNAYILSLRNGFNLVGIIESLSLQINEAQTVKLFLYETSQKTAIATFDLIVDEDYSVIMRDVSDFIIKYRNENKTNLIFLLGYYECDSNNIQPIQLDATTKIYECENHYSGSNDFLDFQSISIPNENLKWNGTTYDLPNLDSYNVTNGMGLNARVSLQCDFTSIIIKYKNYFAEALQNQLALRIITDCNFSKEFNAITESNRKNWSNLILYFKNELYGYEFTDADGIPKFQKGILNGIIKRFEGIDKVCFPRMRNLII